MNEINHLSDKQKAKKYSHLLTPKAKQHEEIHAQSTGFLLNHRITEHTQATECKTGIVKIRSFRQQHVSYLAFSTLTAMESFAGNGSINDDIYFHNKTTMSIVQSISESNSIQLARTEKHHKRQLHLSTELQPSASRPTVAMYTSA